MIEDRSVTAGKTRHQDEGKDDGFGHKGNETVNIASDEAECARTAEST